MPTTSQLDCTGRRRSPATLPGYHQGRPRRNKGLRLSADPPTVEEIIAMMRVAGENRAGLRLRGIIVVLWRTGLWISEAIALSETDLDRARGSIQVRHGKGGRGREVGIDTWAFEQLDPWSELAANCPSGHCSVSCAARPKGGPARRPRSASSCATRRPARGSVAALRAISSATPTRWRCRARASPS